MVSLRGICIVVIRPAQAGRSRVRMFIVYVLKSNTTGRHYIGSTNDLVRRLSEHNRGHTISTRQKGIWAVIYTEECNSLLEARRRERQIKSYKGGNGFKKLIAGVVQR